jgi:hypothetical protein
MTNSLPADHSCLQPDRRDESRHIPAFGDRAIVNALAQSDRVGPAASIYPENEAGIDKALFFYPDAYRRRLLTPLRGRPAE